MMTLVLEQIPVVDFDKLMIDDMPLVGLERTDSGYVAQVAGGEDGRTGHRQVNYITVGRGEWYRLGEVVTKHGLESDFWVAGGIIQITLDHAVTEAWRSGDVILGEVEPDEAAPLTAQDVGMGVVV